MNTRKLRGWEIACFFDDVDRKEPDNNSIISDPLITVFN